MVDSKNNPGRVPDSSGDTPAEPVTDDRSEEQLGLEDFSKPADQGGLSLEALSAAYAQLIDKGAVPYESSEVADGFEQLDPVPENQQAEDERAGDQRAGDERAGNLGAGNLGAGDLGAGNQRAGDHGVSPRSILEAMLFVGNTDNQPLSSQQVAGLMRGVRAREVEDLVSELNREYDSLGCPYQIAAVGEGYLLRLREAYTGLREKFYRRVREARLSQAAVDILAIVAYRQPLTREEVDRLRGRPSGAVLTQLVRRQLLRIERPQENPRRPRYYTTDRFLTIFGLDNLAELPQSQDIDKNF